MLFQVMVTQRLRELVGKGTPEMITTATMLSAEEALLGVWLITCEPDDLWFFVKLASRICKNSSVAIANAIKSVNAGCNTSGYAIEIESLEHVLLQRTLKKALVLLDKRNLTLQATRR